MNLKIKNSFTAALLLALIPLSAQANWAPPAQAPSNANSSAPLNAGSESQTKTGWLTLNTGNAANGLIIQFGNMGLGTTSPSAKFAITALGAGSGRAFALANSSNVEKVTILDNGNVNVSGDVNATRLCIGGVCQGSWPSSVQWTVSGANINYTAGNVSIGTTSSAAKLTVAGGVKVSADTGACTASKAGTIRWSGGFLEACNGANWLALGVAKSCSVSGVCPSSSHGMTCSTYSQNYVAYSSTCPAPTVSRCENGTWNPVPAAYSTCTVSGPTSGCKDPEAQNYSPASDINDPALCSYTSGCKYDTTACNYDPNVHDDDPNSCNYHWNETEDGCREE